MNKLLKMTKRAREAFQELRELCWISILTVSAVIILSLLARFLGWMFQ